MTSDTHSPQLGPFIIVAELRAKPTGPFEAAVGAMGTVFHLTNSVWLLRARTTVGTIRNNLTPHLGPRDTLFVAEMAGHTAWLNLGPEVDAHIRAIVQAEAKA